MAITQAGASDKVSALVYVAAFAPSEGQAANDLGKEFEPPVGMKRLRSDDTGYLSLPAEVMANDFAPDVPKAATNLMAVSQVPINSKGFDEKVAEAVELIASIPGITREQADALVHAGLTRIEDLVSAEPGDISDIPQIGESAAAILEAARAEAGRRGLLAGEAPVNS